MNSNILRAALPKLLRRKSSSLPYHSSTARFAATLSFVCLSHQSIASSEAEYQKEQTFVKSNLVKFEPKGKMIAAGKIAELLLWVGKTMNNLRAIIYRFMYLIFSFSPAVLAAPILLLDNYEFKRWWWVVLRNCIRQSGPCFTKFAQWISTRPDLFPLSVCKNLEDLQSNAAIHSWFETERTLVHSFGTDWRKSLRIAADNSTDNVSNGFRPAVLGSGCVAQVLLGQLDGKRVAVKIIHPGVRDAIEADVKILQCLSSMVELIPGTKYFSLSDCVEEFSSLMLLQLDMTLEADNLDKLRRNFLISSVESERQQETSENKILDFLKSSFYPSSPLASGLIDRLRSSRRVTFPEPKRPFVSTDILVESYEEGRPISEILDQMSNKTLRRDIATAGLDAVLKMVFIDNFIHADLHPGNVMFHEIPACDTPNSPSLLTSEQSASGNKWELSFIDAGLISTLSQEDRRNFVDLFSAVVQNDGEKVGQLMVDRSRDGGLKCLNREMFAVEIGELVNEVHSSGLSLGRIGIGALLQRVLALCYTYQVKLEPKFVSVMIALGIVEGLGKRLDPDVDVLIRAAPYVLRASTM